MTATTETDRVDLTGEPFDIEIKFCWVDEDGARMSPVHKTILAALNFLVGWDDARERLERAAVKAQEKYDDELERIEHWQPEGGLPQIEGRKRSAVQSFDYDVNKINEAKFKITRTGKPPAQLRRLVTSTVVQDPSEDELLLARTTAKTHDIELKEDT